MSCVFQCCYVFFVFFLQASEEAFGNYPNVRTVSIKKVSDTVPAPPVHFVHCEHAFDLFSSLFCFLFCSVIYPSNAILISRHHISPSTRTLQTHIFDSITGWLSSLTPRSRSRCILSFFVHIQFSHTRVEVGCKHHQNISTILQMMRTLI